MKVLIAEDEPGSRRLLEATLKRWGYDVLVASDRFRVARHPVRSLARATSPIRVFRHSFS